MDKKEIVFIRIPRTASSMVTLICRSNGFKIIGHNSRNPDYKYFRDYKKESMQNVFAFTFVRNPWDRVVSSFYYLNRAGQEDKQDAIKHVKKYRGDFDLFVRQAFLDSRILDQVHFRPQYVWISDYKGQPDVDFIGRFENLKTDLESLFKLVGLDKKILSFNLHSRILNKLLRETLRNLFDSVGAKYNVLTVANKSKHKDYRSYYNEKTKAIIREVYKKDVEFFGYEF